MVPLSETASSDLVIRPLRTGDSFDRMTEILHSAYARLASMGLSYKAVDQPVTVTRERAEEGECYVATVRDHMIGTVTLRPPWVFSGPTPWYQRDDVAVFGQFAIAPDWQQRGIGGDLVRMLERRAAELGAAELALDTAEPARHLVDWYTGMGYRFVEFAQWGHTNYRTLILSKRLPAKTE